MRRILLAAALIGACLAAVPAGAATVTRSTSLGFDGSAYNPNNSGFSFMGCNVSQEETIGGSTTSSAYCNVYVTDGMGNYGYGTGGTIALTFDEALATGTIQGTVGNVVVNLSFLASTVGSNTLPYAAVEVVPTAPQQAGGVLSRSQAGRISGTVTSPQTGTVTGSNGGSNVYRYTALVIR